MVHTECYQEHFAGLPTNLLDYKRIMPVDSKAITVSPEKSSSQMSRERLHEAGDSKQAECSSSASTHDKRGLIFSKIARHIAPKTPAAHDSTRVKIQTNSYNDCMAPEPDEIPSRAGASSSLNSATSDDIGLQSSLLWP